MNERRPVLEDPGRASSHGVAEEGTASFSRHRYELPLMCVFLGLALLELVAMHLLLSNWSLTAAWILSVLSVLAIVQIAWLIRGMVRYPTEVDARAVQVRYGAAGRLVVPLASIERAENVSFTPEAKGASVFRATVIASPNIALHLANPVKVRRRAVSTVTLRLDDPAGFLTRIAGRGQAD